MKTRGMFSLVAIVALVCMAGNFAFAAEKGSAAAGGPIQHILEAAKELNLTDDQKTKLKALIKDFEASHNTPAMREKIQNNPDLRETLREMKAAKESGDEARMKELRQKIASEMGGAGGIAKGEAGHGEFIKKLAAILTPDQMQKLKAMREAKGEGRAGAGNSSTPDKTQKPDASKGVPNPFE